jgi:hypothetical protein
MVNTRITHPTDLIKRNQAQHYRLELLLGHAAGLGLLIIENDLLEYQEDSALHRSLWLLIDLVIEAHELSEKASA